MLRLVCSVLSLVSVTAQTLDDIVLPDGFHIEYYSAEITAQPRALASIYTLGTTFTAVGTKVLDSNSEALLYCLIDKHDGSAVVTRAIWSADAGIAPTSVAIEPVTNDLYIAHTEALYRCDNPWLTILGWVNTDDTTSLLSCTLVFTIPGDTTNYLYHNRRYIRFSPEGKLCISIGSKCDACFPDSTDTEEGSHSGDGTVELERNIICYDDIATATQWDADYSILVTGMRNSVGFDWHPTKPNLFFFTDNGRNDLGYDIPDDELNLYDTSGDGSNDFGHPCCHSTVPDPSSSVELRPPGSEVGSIALADTFSPWLIRECAEKGVDCSEKVMALQCLGPHIAALGMRFYPIREDGTGFPSTYHEAIFIAHRGSLQRPDDQIGPKVVVAFLNAEGTEVIDFKDFAHGWEYPVNTYWGRIVEVEVMEYDGSLLVSSDYMSTYVYRIWYEPIQHCCEAVDNLPKFRKKCNKLDECKLDCDSNENCVWNDLCSDPNQCVCCNGHKQCESYTDEGSCLAVSKWECSWSGAAACNL